MKIFYTYDPVTHRPNGTSETETKHSSKWKPPSDDCLFDGVGWVLAPDDPGLKDEDILSILVERELDKEDDGEVFTDLEQSTFFFQYSEASAYLKDSSSPTPYMDAAAVSGESKEVLAKKIVSKYEASLTKAAQLRVKRKDLENAWGKLSRAELLVMLHAI